MRDQPLSTGQAEFPTLSATAPFSLYPIVRTGNKTMSSATKAVAANFAMFPLVTAQTVASKRGVGGRISG
jgi:hypothetical protein